MLHSPALLLFFLAGLLNLGNVHVRAQRCGPAQPCDIGCCGPFGYCGFGAPFCGPGNCTGNCEAKSDCDAGWGAEWSAREKCPLNVCCSQYGYCGLGEAYCGDAKVTEPSCSGASSSARTVGYYEGWSMDRPCERMAPEQIPIAGYTHLLYAFVFIDPLTYAIMPMAENQTSLYSRITALKRRKPGLQVWISIGGWTMTDPMQPTRETFSKLAADAAAQAAFFYSLTCFLQDHGFDGVDIDWEYPVAPERGGSPEDYKNFVTFLQNLRSALSTQYKRFGLSIAVPAGFYYLQNFDIVRLAKLVDWFNLMTYDYHGIWDANNPEIGSVVLAHTNLTEIKESLDLLWLNGISPQQINLGLAFYGRSFTLSNEQCRSPGCPFSGPGKRGPCTNNDGTLSDDEIADAVAGGAQVSSDKIAAVKYASWGDQWVSYDDQDTFASKIQFANERCLGGTMVWAVSQDSFGISSGALAKLNGDL